MSKRPYSAAFREGVVEFVTSLFSAKKGRTEKKIAFSEFPPELLEIVLDKFGQEGLNQLALTNREYYEMVREFQRRKGDDRKKYVVDIETFVNVIDDEEKSLEEKFDAICKRIDESKPFNLGKRHDVLTGRVGKVRNLVFNYLKDLDDVARSDEIYKLLIALASKEELLRPEDLYYSDQARSDQIGATCIPANRYPPGSNQNWEYKGWSLTDFCARVGNPHPMSDGVRPYLTVSAYGPPPSLWRRIYLNFVDFPPQQILKVRRQRETLTLVDVLKVAREHKCIIMASSLLPYEELIKDQLRYVARVKDLSKAIAALAEAFFLCDKEDDEGARIRTAFVDLAVATCSQDQTRGGCEQHSN